ncbi:MAG: hypothetical protein MJK18_09105, partial [Bdellovibrionales bacterium]|nr:hypothetical protein [Bdellovibrionales bacterium]
MFKYTLSILLILFSSTAIAVVPGSFAYQGQIIKPNGKPLEASSVEFTIDILSPGAEQCLLYTEIHTLNMDDSAGIFSIDVGTGTRSGANYEDTSLLIDVFDNTLPIQTPTTCDSVGTYTPSAGDSRLVRVTFNDGSGPITVSQDHRTNSVPYADHASKLDGLDATDFIQVNDGAGQELSQANIDTIFSTANYNELLDLINGTSTNYMVSTPAAAPNFNNQIIEGVAAPVDPDDAANKDYVDNNIGGAAADDLTIGGLGVVETGHVLVWNGSEWTAGAPAGDTTKLPLSGGTMTGGIDMGNQDISNVNDISLNGGLGVGTGINSSGDITLLNESELRLGDDDGIAHYVGFKAPNAVAGNQIWTLPAADGTLSQGLTTDASGTLVWTNLALRDGFSGGQTINGGLDANDDLTLDSTANATKGDVLINPTGGYTGVGTTTPVTSLEVQQGASGGSPALSGGETLRVQRNSAPGAAASIHIVSGSPGQAALFMGNESQNSIGGLIYDHNADSMSIRTNSANDRVCIDSTGNVGVGTNAPSGRLDVEGGDSFFGTSTLDNPSGTEDVLVSGNIEVDGIIYGDASGLTNIPSSS